MEQSPQSRLTIALAIAAIVAAIGLLLAGVVLAPSGTDPEETEASLVASASADVAAGPTTTAAHPHEELAVADVPTTDTTAAAEEHAHDDTAVAAGDASVAITVPVADAHGEHLDVATTIPAATGEVVVTTPTTVHDHGSVATTTVPAAPDAPTTTVVPTGPIVSLDDSRLSAAQKATAEDLLANTVAGMARFPDEAAVVAAGYLSIGDGGTGFEHFVNVGYLTDGFELDANHIESIVLRVSGGTKTVASAMYILTTGSTMADVPEIAGELTTWHDHQNLCWDGIRVVAVTNPDGSCPRGVFRPTAPMLHVWLTPQPCGPFSGIEGTHGDACASHGH